MLPNILKETVRGIQPILIEDEMLQHREVFLIEEVNRKSATDMIKQLMYLDRIDTGKPVTVYINKNGKESGGLQLHGRGTGIDTHEPKYELICSIRFEESTVYGAKHRTY